MAEKVAFLFAGQGAQFVGMGKDLYETFPESKTIFENAERILRFPLKKLCFEGPEHMLKMTHISQPAILTVSIASLEAFKSKFNISTSYAAGLSLGEYSALVASEAISFADALYLVKRRGEIMQAEAEKKPGRMLSIIGLDLDRVREICMDTTTEIANINCPGQIVISGGTKEIEQAYKLAESKGAKRAVYLEVSGAFHSSIMKEASLLLAEELSKIKIGKPKVPVVSNVTAKPVSSAPEIKENLIKQIASSVLWEDSMRFMLSQGVNKLFEFGPGKVLKGLMRRIDNNIPVVSIEKKEDILNLS